MLPTNRKLNLLTRPRASSKTTDSFFLGFSNKYKHSRLCIFKLFSAATAWSSSSQWNLLHDNPKHVWSQPPLDLTKDLHTQQNRATLKTWLGFSLLYLRQNIKPYTSNGLGLSWKILQKNILPEFRSIESNSQSIEQDRIAQ